MRQLEDLTLEYMPITDACIPHLAKLTKLRLLSLFGTKVTAAGAAKLKRAIPGVLISR